MLSRSSASSSYSPSFSSFFIALMADLKSSEAAFQFYPVLVLSKPLPLVIPIFFFSSTLVCFTICAYNHHKCTCSFPTLLASELNSFLLDMNTNLQAFACFSKAFLLNFLPQPSGHITKSFSLSGGSVSSCSSSWIGFYSCCPTSCLEFCLYIFWGGGGSSLLVSYLGGGSYRLGSSLGCSLVINMRFCNGILGG